MRMATRKKRFSKKSDSNGERSNYLHLLVDYLADGVGAVERRVRKENISEAIVRRAAEELKKSHGERKAEELSNWVDTNFPTGKSEQTRGKTPPKPGDIREYKAQKLRKGGTFLRLPLDAMNVKKEDRVAVEFGEDFYKVYKVKNKATS